MDETKKPDFNIVSVICFVLFGSLIVGSIIGAVVNQRINDKKSNESQTTVSGEGTTGNSGFEEVANLKKQLAERSERNRELETLIYTGQKRLTEKDAIIRDWEERYKESTAIIITLAASDIKGQSFYIEVTRYLDEAIKFLKSLPNDNVSER
jgi:hypothetical protein